MLIKLFEALKLKKSKMQASVSEKTRDFSVVDEVRETFKNIEIGTVFTTHEIKTMVAEKYGRKMSSVIPSDYSYNMTNKGIEGTPLEKFNLFIQLERGVYRYVGENYTAKEASGTDTTATGYINKNNQRNNGRERKSENHYNQWFYNMECLNCGNKYLANGADIWLRKCPKCQRTKKADRGETRTSRNIPDRIRYQVLKRDNFKCCACGASPATCPGVELHIDHIVPYSKGGETVIENLQTLCSKCNLGKSNVL